MSDWQTVISDAHTDRDYPVTSCPICGEWIDSRELELCSVCGDTVLCPACEQFTCADCYKVVCKECVETICVKCYADGPPKGKK